jgi:antitoxin component YwqK of YwqJK toxin-antitoxin module
MHVRFVILLYTLLALMACSASDKYDNGQLKERVSTFQDKNGNLIKQGAFIQWYENGQKKQQGTFVHDRMDGEFYEWYENGQMKSLRRYTNGELNGVSTWWTEDGHVKSEVDYVDGYRR